MSVINNVENSIKIQNSVYEPLPVYETYVDSLIEKHHDKFDKLLGLNIIVLKKDDFGYKRDGGLKNFYKIHTMDDIGFMFTNIDVVILLNSKYSDEIENIKEPLFYHILSSLNIKENKDGDIDVTPIGRIKVSLEKNDLKLYNDSYNLFGAWFDELKDLERSVQEKKG